ncbi:response regulator [Maribacter sp. X9]|uniref:response regulator n=1 Tax=Maribacter sp. X9 TaxID=3402159 RepID=UPI003AF377E6
MNKESLNIALADDDDDDRMLFKLAIEELSLKTEVSYFENGQELLDHLNLENTTLPNLIFLDLNMPIKNGMQCLKEIRQNPKFDLIAVAIYSTSSSEKDIEETFVNGANIYINKPPNFNTLCKVIEKVVRLKWQYHTSNLNRDTFLFRI